MFDVLLHSKAFWLALIVFVGAIANYFGLPKEIVSTGLGVLGAVATVFAAQEVRVGSQKSVVGSRKE